MELRNARHLAARYLEETVRPGDHVIDATMGNGHDTAFLANLVGEQGMVDAFDVQEMAVQHTRERLDAAGLLPRTRLHLAGHETVLLYVKDEIRAAMFNLGWLPGGDHTVTTRVETTLGAIRDCVSLLLPLGIVTVCVYPGHEEGKRELTAVDACLAGMSPQQYVVLRHDFLNALGDAPRLFVVQRNS